MILNCWYYILLLLFFFMVLLWFSFPREYVLSSGASMYRLQVEQLRAARFAPPATRRSFAMPAKAVTGRLRLLGVSSLQIQKPARDELALSYGSRHQDARYWIYKSSSRHGNRKQSGAPADTCCTPSLLTPSLSALWSAMCIDYHPL